MKQVSYKHMFITFFHWNRNLISDVYHYYYWLMNVGSWIWFLVRAKCFRNILVTGQCTGGIPCINPVRRKARYIVNLLAVVSNCVHLCVLCLCLRVCTYLCIIILLWERLFSFIIEIGRHRTISHTRDIKLKANIKKYKSLSNSRHKHFKPNSQTNTTYLFRTFSKDWPWPSSTWVPYSTKS